MQANAIKQVKKKRITKIYRSPVDPQLKAGIGSHYLQIQIYTNKKVKLEDVKLANNEKLPWLSTRCKATNRFFSIFS